MADVLVLVEQVDGKLKKVTAELLTAAKALGEPAAVVVGAPAPPTPSPSSSRPPAPPRSTARSRPTPTPTW